ncbi:flavodoxin [Enterococcus thailandicus]|uniref:flavodoxin n=1 Tax=Enterococcus thailandicus TaxID=417368 RepID=UPI0022EBBEB3|nr:flavodoxin [Enterococcus thailandicus]MDA3972775.1 flavodoxin [Enterococcus thailandicus]MDA3975271.1 flavodoxin [Enterococcus thailandicus]MDA3980235.1 flavodoxin [Enterococcus thailandicus]
MKKKSVVVLLIFAFVLSACDISNESMSDSTEISSSRDITKSISNRTSDKSDKKSLIVYFSIPETLNADAVSGASQAEEDGQNLGNVQFVAEKIQSVVKGDILRLEVEEPYPKDYDETVDRAREEERNNTLPRLTTVIPDLNQYEVIYIGYPVWNMTVPSPIRTFLSQSNIENKRVALFATHAGYGLGNSDERIEELIPNNTFTDVLDIEDNEVNDSNDTVKNWITDSNLLE